MRRSIRALVAATGLAVLGGVAGCAGGSGAADVAFAHVSGDVVVTPVGAGDTATLVLVAPPGNAVWEQIDELHVVNDAADGAAMVFVPGTDELEPGERHGGVRFGSISVDVPEDTSEMELSTVKLRVGDSADLVSYDVGDWRMTRSASDPGLRALDTYPGVQSCSSVRFDVEDVNGEDFEVLDVTTAAPGLGFVNVDVRPQAGGVTSIEFDLDCDDAYDLYTFSPRLSVDRNGDVQEEAFLPITVGTSELASDEVIARILER
ncbi:hypothetical protein [Microbacterium amylolyticum]|uniref:Lipoprotein n=1 Tax=Microbacterium amylolyticum TaxID=936337 RepID=A0ABS4ZIG6_9MICO|nr:hypothetical protein [Microbacterium amylolyticum]MBP2436848.1 hypothetical protein [Microbacterium amylolyticum]